MTTRFFHNRFLVFQTNLLRLKHIAVWVFFVIMGFSLVSCSSDDTNGNDVESIRAQITEYNASIVELSQKVSELERTLEDMGESNGRRSRLPVTVETIDGQDFDNYVNVNANVEAIREAIISPEANGQISRIAVSKGQRVQKGQELARLNTAVLENNIAEVKTSLQLAETTYKRQKSLWEQEIGSEMQYLQAKSNYESMQSRLKTLQSQRDMSVMTAPFSGIVDEIFAKEGELAMPGTPIMQLLDLNELYVNADVSEAILPSVSKGDMVILRFPSYPDFEARLPVYRIGNVINPENRTFRLQLKIDNPQDRFKPNMVGRISVKTFSAEQALVVPSIIVKQDTQGYYVYLARENDRGEMMAQKVYVERGRAGEGLTMIVSGLSSGDLLIRRGHNQVIDGSLLSIADEVTDL